MNSFTVRRKGLYKWILASFASVLIITIYISDNNSCDKPDRLLSKNYDTSETAAIIDKWWNLAPNEFTPDCKQLLSFDNSDKTLKAAAVWNPSIPKEDDFCSHSCEQIIDYFAFPKQPKTVEESEFPLAFIFMAQRNIFQTLTLFRTIYWPQNVYCINWDTKSSPKYIRILRDLISCLPNVITPPFHRKISWGEYSLLQATMDCVQLLNSYDKISWKYLQIVSWNDFPIKTNYEMVQIFKILNGANDVGLELAHMNYIYKKCDPYSVKDCHPPGSVVIYKGSYAVSLSRDFVRFTVTDKVAVDLYEWLQGTWCAEEHYWSTLNHNLHLNPSGGYPGWCLQYYLLANDTKPAITRLQQWSDNKPCKGKNVKASCVFGVYDLAEIVLSNYLWAHKVYEEYQPGTLYCLQKWFYDKSNRPQNTLNADQLSYYANLSYVKHKNSDKKEEINCHLIE